MAESLLAHLYSRIKGSQEDVATISLQYIISASPKLNEAFNRIISNALGVEIPFDTTYTCQSVGEESERPDMSGVDKDGKEVVLCEMKFYAGLTSNQPNGYLNRLIKEGGKGLVFVCPEQRRVTLWNKIKKLCEEDGKELSNDDDNRVIVDGIAMAVISWVEIIEELRRVASSVAVEFMPDIAQLSGFCEMMDDSAFIPFSPEDFGTEVARREERFYQVIDRLFEVLIANKSIDTSSKNLKASPNRNGYTRYLMINNYAVALMYNRNAWMNNTSVETPFWFYFNDDEWKQTDELKGKLRGVSDFEQDILDGRVVLALHPLTDVPLDEVAFDMMRQILDYMKDYIS